MAFFGGSTSGQSSSSSSSTGFDQNGNHQSSSRSNNSSHRFSSNNSGGNQVDTVKLYDTLQVAKSADVTEIKKAFRRLAVIHHPDKGGDEHKFKEVSAAYEILSDPEKRAKYDKYGLEGVGTAAEGRNGDDLFSMFFGGTSANGRQRRSGPRRGEDVNHTLNVSLEDLYNGKTLNLVVNRSVLNGDPVKCTTCDGKGVVVELRQIALGMVQQLQRRCQACGGEGYQCSTSKERKVLQVHVESGMKHNDKIVFHGMADEKPNVETGNINIVIHEKEHELFKRKGADLMIRKALSLNEALCGFAFKIIHMDGRQLIVKSMPGEVIRATCDSGQPFVKIVKGEGMPSRGNMIVKGDLYVMFTVEFPKDNELSNEVVELLRKTLPNPSMQLEYDDESAEVTHLSHASVRDYGNGGVATSNPAYPHDGAGTQPPQCHQS